MRAAALLFAALGLSGCRAEHVVVTVEDPEDVARDADTLAIGFELEKLDEVLPIGDSDFPLTFALAYHEPTVLTVHVAAREGDAIVARGSTPVSLEDGAAAFTVRLGKACEVDLDCDDQLFCNGEESCLQKSCVRAPEPCSPITACATHRCDEDHDLCEVVLDVGLNDFDPCTIDGCGAAEEIIHLPVPEGEPCIGEFGNCQGRECRLICGDGLLDPRVEECDPGSTPNGLCVECKLMLSRLTSRSGDFGAISRDGQIVAFRDDGKVIRLNRATGDRFEVNDGAPMDENLVVDGRISMSNDGGKIAAAGSNGFAIYDGVQPRELVGGVRPFVSVVVSNDGNYLFMSSQGGSFANLTKFVSGWSEVAWAENVSQMELFGSDMAYRGSACSPCLRRGSNPHVVVERDGLEWAFAGSGAELFVASSSVGMIRRYELATLQRTIIPNTDGASELAVSDDGRRIAFKTRSPLAPDDTNGCDDIYVIDLDAPSFLRRLGAGPGFEPDGDSYGPAISADGRWVIYTSLARNLDPTDNNSTSDVFLAKLE